MPREIYSLEELDDNTREYLRTIRNRGGAGMPGVYLAQTWILPWVGIILGIVVIGLVFFVTMPPFEDPTRIAMLRSAGILLGGWMILAALRVWLGSSTGKNLGYFYYADPRQLFHVQGTKVTRWPLEEVQHFELKENYDNEDNFQSATLFLVYPGQKEVLTVHQKGFPALSAYLAKVVETRHDPEWQQLTPEEFGRAIRTALEGEEPGGEAVHIPVPNRVRPVAFGWLNLALITLAALGLFFLLKPMVVAERDQALFDMLTKEARPQDAPAMWRAYLLDPNNKNPANRERIQALLYARYVPKLEEVRKSARAEEPDKTLNRGWEMVLEHIAKSLQPVISLRARENTLLPTTGELAEVNAQARQEKVRQTVSDSLMIFVGPELLDFAKVPDEVPTMIDIQYAFEANPKAPGFLMKWKVGFRKSPDDVPQTATWEEIVAPGSIDQQVDAQVRRLLKIWTGFDKPKAGLDPFKGDF